MKDVIERIVFLFIGILLLLYSYFPSPSFPNPPENSVQSEEDADTEYIYRRAYFTDFTREEVIQHYKSQFGPFASIRLNYPPEDAQTLIRDQTRSRYLEELVHPLRDSIYINGFIPTESKDDIWYKGVHYYQKVTIRYIPSSLITRLGVSLMVFIAVYWLYKEWGITISKLINRKEGNNV